MYEDDPVDTDEVGVRECPGCASLPLITLSTDVEVADR